MSETTTIRLPPKLRARLRAIAKETDRSVHSLIVEAVEKHAAYEEQMRSLVKEALEADADIERTGECTGPKTCTRGQHVSRRAWPPRGPSRGGSSLFRACTRKPRTRVSILLRENPDAAIAAAEAIASAIHTLASHPLIGRRIEGDLRELVISFGATGYIALYRFVVQDDQVRVLALRHQREIGYLP